MRVPPHMTPALFYDSMTAALPLQYEVLRETVLPAFPFLAESYPRPRPRCSKSRAQLLYMSPDHHAHDLRTGPSATRYISPAPCLPYTCARCHLTEHNIRHMPAYLTWPGVLHGRQCYGRINARWYHTFKPVAAFVTYEPLRPEPYTPYLLKPSLPGVVQRKLSR